MVDVMAVLEPSKLPDDAARIQDAINRVENLPMEYSRKHNTLLRGAVLLKKGEYRVTGSLDINQSGVVLRGEGSKPDGTVIKSIKAVHGSLINITGHMVSTEGPQSLEIKGDNIVVERPGSQQWVSEIRMGSNPPEHDPYTSYEWDATLFTFRFERTIVEIDHNSDTITVDIPMIMSFGPKYGPGRIYPFVHKYNTISDVGIENLRLIGNMDLHHPKTQQQTVPAINIDNTIHDWVSDVVAETFAGGIQASRWSRFITIQNCEVRGLNGFVLQGQMGLR
ncbi:hypothetical protein BGZ70_000979 [Mortierella alpina]|uniref:Uncharacterized protein n=1 Tax=Mortierella alpina TaxID=64518 RepID=A0A9P6JCF4_MORAP|nr:hypothetical protein BGZ70_000979 [Mortierella alpina]